MATKVSYLMARTRLESNFFFELQSLGSIKSTVLSIKSTDPRFDFEKNFIILEHRLKLFESSEYTKYPIVFSNKDFFLELLVFDVHQKNHQSL